MPASRFLPSLVALAFLGCTDPVRPVARTGPSVAHAEADASEARRLVVFDDERVPPGFAERVAALGGRVERSLDEMGIATVSALSDESAATLAADAGVRGVERIAVAEDADGMAGLAMDDTAEPATVADALDVVPAPTQALLFARQWNLRAVHAPDAWEAGYLGWDKATVAIIDTGIDYLNPELAGLVDVENSVSFAPDDAETLAQYPDRLPFTDRFWHGTANASLVTSAGRQLAGVNQQVRLIAIKVSGRGEQATSDVNLAALYWAVKHGADVVSIGGGFRLDKLASPLVYEAYVRAFDWAWRKGTLTTVPAGDVGRNLDTFFPPNTVGIPCDIAHTLCVSLTAPSANAPTVNGPWTNVDAIQSTNNFGTQIDVAAPGGSRFVNTRIWLTCTTSPLAGVSPATCLPGAGYTGLVQGIGTSWSSATVAGLAAMLVTKYGHNHADLIRARILESADDLGAPGWDPYYGWGRINVARAIDVPVRRGRNGDEER